MPKHEIIKIFGERKVRSVWDDEAEKWYFSVVDVVAVLTDSANPATYWRVLKKRLKDEGNETVTNCNGLKLRAEDGKMRLTDVADQEQLFRLIQSIPSPKAEPFKVWMAKTASERLDQIQDPELSIQQALADYRRLGYSGEAAAWRRTRVSNLSARRDARSSRRSMRPTRAHWKSILATFRLCPRLDAARRDVVSYAAVQASEEDERKRMTTD